MLQTIMMAMRRRLRTAKVTEYAASILFCGWRFRKHQVPGYWIAYWPKPISGREEKKMAITQSDTKAHLIWTIFFRQRPSFHAFCILPGSIGIKVEHVKVAVTYSKISLYRHCATQHRGEDSEQDHRKGVIHAHPRLHLHPFICKVKEDQCCRCSVCVGCDAKRRQR